MTRAILLGSIGTLAETSHMQREAFNAAFQEAGLGWEWSEDDYAVMLRESGGRARIERFASHRGETVDAAALHARKSEIFRDMLLSRGAEPRPGVIETLDEARAAGCATGFVTAAAPEIVHALLDAVGLRPETFDIVFDATTAPAPKPAPDIYGAALARLNVRPSDAIAVEDNPPGVAAALRAGLVCVAFPGAAHRGGTFPAGIPAVQSLSFGMLRQARAA